MNPLDNLPPIPVPPPDRVRAPVTKAAGAWAGAGLANAASAAGLTDARPLSFLDSIGIHTWADAASFLAAAYTASLIGEWAWKRFVRPFGERRGWWKVKRRASA